MDKHFSLIKYNDPDTIDYKFLIINRSDDVIGIVNIRSYKKDCITEINGLINDISYEELKNIIENFVRVCEKTSEYDKVGQSYYIAKNWLKNEKT